MKRKSSRLEQNIVRVAILDFAAEHKLVIDPSRGFEHQVENYFRFGHCPCDPTASRTRCPCMESLVDIKETGHCLCRLFWKDLKTFRKLYEVKDEESDREKTAPGDRGGGGGDDDAGSPGPDAPVCV